MSTSSTRLSQHVSAPRADARAVGSWMVPQRMTSQVHIFEPRDGGSFRISLTDDAAR